MNNITYYHGAGASYNSQPLLATMKDRMLLLLNYLNEEKNQESMDQPLFNVAGTQKLYDKYYERTKFDEQLKHNAIKFF